MDNRRAFKRRVFEKTLRKYLAQAGISADAIDFESLDLDSYERLYDLIYDLAHDNRHELQPVFSQLLRAIHKTEEYYGPPEDLYSQVKDEDGGGARGEGDRLSEIEATLGILEKRVSMLEDMQVAENKEIVTELHNAIYDLNHEVASLKQKVDGIMEQARGPGRRADGPRRRPAPRAEESPAPRGVTGLKLVIAGTISTFLAFTVIPMAAYTNGWSFSETVAYGAAFLSMCIGLMALEGLWARVAFPDRRRTAHGFVTGYLYSQGTNPYENG